MTLFEYIDKYGDYSFEDKEINEVDNMIFSFLSYVNLQNIELSEKETLESVSKKVFSIDRRGKKSIIAEKDALRLLKAIMNKKRYKDCLLFNYIYEVDDDSQFSVITIEYLNNHIYISFEGTDEMISSWYEDFLLSYQYPTKSHVKAVEYLKRYTLSKYSIILGGHSKGGNIALVAAMNTNPFVKSKITDIYSMDGPGLLPEILNSKKYKRIERKYHHIVPENSLVGMLLENTNEVVIKTTASGILAHDILYWEITNNYITRSRLSYFSRTLRKSLNKYIYSLTKDELEEVIKQLGDICKKLNIKSLVEIMDDNNKIVLLMKEIAKVNGRTKKMLTNIVEIFVKSYGKSLSLRLENKFNKFKERIINEIKSETKKVH